MSVSCGYRRQIQHIWAYSGGHKNDYCKWKICCSDPQNLANWPEDFGTIAVETVVHADADADAIMQWCSRVHLVRVRVQWVRVRVHLVRVRVRVQWARVQVQASRSDRVSKSCHSQSKHMIRHNNTVSAVTCWKHTAILQHIHTTTRC